MKVEYYLVTDWGERRSAMRVIERIAKHYEVQEVEKFARVYRWCPEVVVVECECGKRVTFRRSKFTGSEVLTCECSKDKSADIQEEMVGQMLEEDDETLHPWRYWRPPKGAGIPF
jgi:hypothetical protein